MAMADAIYILHSSRPSPHKGVAEELLQLGGSDPQVRHTWEAGPFPLLL